MFKLRCGQYVVNEPSMRYALNINKNFPSYEIKTKHVAVELTSKILPSPKKYYPRQLV